METIKSRLILLKGRKNKSSSDWRAILSSSIVTADQLKKYLSVNTEEVYKTASTYPLQINRYFLSLIKKKNDPMWKQVVPDIRELSDSQGTDDPLMEEQFSPVLNLIHRYPDRVLFIVSNRCAVFCRFCTRKRLIGRRSTVSEDSIKRGVDYISQNPAIKDVILSGGDPLLLEDEVIYHILVQLRAIPHIKTIRFHTRAVSTLPQRITERLVSILKQFHPIYINTHFNHPDEVTSEVITASTMLAEGGIPLGCQTVLLKGVNDNSNTMKRLMTKLLQIRIRPYYIHHPDIVKGTRHFRPSINKGLAIMKSMRGHLSGMCIPQYMIDLPGGGGKVPLLPDYIKKIKDGRMKVESFDGKYYEYPMD